MSLIDSSVRSDGAVIVTGVTEYDTSYGSNEVSIEWEAVIKNKAIVSVNAHVLNGWEPDPLTVVNYEIMHWMNTQAKL